ncbi:MAG: bifunctional 4-hydroxy-2-oxoglutarate aldolase/2-dehydro-3-deoxy-phosphogluconate aldolase [Ignavibacteriales bacterium]|nr:bifunctional 4-hydroxy-2-oxoglutarate aldolase/2-dehydro-3-deoxy-phosphogluconate aldolase [Ignavibacteriales bacterium]
MNQILKQIGLLGLVPVVIIDDEKDAEGLADALVQAGLPCAEITFRTSAAERVIKKIHSKYPEMLLGAGTVLNIDQVKSAIDAGASFIVSPGLNPKVIEYCLSNNILITPGIATPTEIGTAMEFGLEVVKFFPAEANGGLEYLKAIAAPYNNVQFIPTGGIDENNLLPYLNFPNVLACGGSWMVSRELISKGSFEQINILASQAVSKVLGFSLRHIGINTPDAATSYKISTEISKIFNMRSRDTEGSVFVAEQFEVMKHNYLGTHGHIAITTNFIERAIDHFNRRGVKIIPDTKNIINGKLKTVYVDLDLGGFAVHLVQN